MKISVTHGSQRKSNTESIIVASPVYSLAESGRNQAMVEFQEQFFDIEIITF